MMMARRFTLIGPGRAGMSLHRALIDLGWTCPAVFGRDDVVANAASDVELCVIATPDSEIAKVAAAIEPADAIVMHLSGATPLSALGAHRSAAMHPLLSLATPERGAEALGACFYAVAGESIAHELADALSGKWFPIADDDRALYHGAAAVAANHLVALLGQVERICEEVDVPFSAFMSLIQSSVDYTAALGAKAALTGPVARGDEATIEQHRLALHERLPQELAGYDAMVELARRLVK